MYMWAVPPAPGETNHWKKQSKKAKKSPEAPSNLAIPAKPPTPSSTVSPGTSQPPQMAGEVDSFKDFLEPSVDGPPSPESIRLLSKQMKRTSYVDKHLSQHTSSSGSSSLRSQSSADRPSWEQTMEGFPLSRKSSGRSTSSSMPSRERPESVQIFGKTIFSRRGKLRRESSSQSVSATTSPYLSEFQSEASLQSPANPKDPAASGFFGRRRALTRDSSDDAISSKKFQISEPYNFQHVTHTPKDNLPSARRSSRAAVAAEFSQMQSPPLPGGALQGIRADDLNYADHTPESFHTYQGEAMAEEPELYSQPNLARRRSVRGRAFSPPRRLVRNLSEDQLVMSPPPRPPRSPLDPPAMPHPPIPPPRLSSRASIAYDSVEPMPRPQTSGGFRQSRKLSIDEELPSPPSTAFSPRGGELDSIAESRFSRMISPTDDANWPLISPTNFSTERLQTLPNVPEEDENTFQARRSRASVASNSSSLRGSQSVPMLRHLSLRQEKAHRRQSSGGSETLGSLFAAGIALKASIEEANAIDSLARESWEDDIDYCYDHAVEADCEYAWERPSLDLIREDENATPMFHLPTIESCDVSPSMANPPQFDLPALSPASQLSHMTAQEAITPTVPALPRASNFSMPRQDPNLLHVRRESAASSFKESQGFNLSPSLLIPNDFQHQMMIAEVDEEGRRSQSFPFHPFGETTLNMESSNLLVHARSSGSTTGSIDTTHTNGFERHRSTASASTDFTRLTRSTSSLDMESFMNLKDELTEPMPSFEQNDGAYPMPTLPESDEIFQRPLDSFNNSGSDPNLAGLAKGTRNLPTHSKDPVVARRQRSRTASLSTPPPPGQYSLFPGVQMTGPRI